MFGIATLEIPGSGNIGPSKHPDLSDEIALSLGRLAAQTLSDEDGCVKITYSNGDVRLIGHDTANDVLVIGR